MDYGAFKLTESNQTLNATDNQHGSQTVGLSFIVERETAQTVC